MPPSRVIRAALSERACLQCQKRKTRCVPSSGDADEPCQYCAKSHRECTFPERPPRTPLTRKNLEDAESRCKELESLLEQFRRSSADCNTPALTPASAPNATTSDARPLDPVPKGSRFVRTTVSEEGVDASPYEWDETLVEDEVPVDLKPARDGMATFGGGNVGSGYMGTTSGRAMLDSISSAFSNGATSSFQCPQQDVPTRFPEHRKLIHPLARTLATSYVQEQLITAYFDRYNKSYPVVHEGIFRTKCVSRSRHFRNNSWYMLYYMIMAIGEWVGGFTNDQHSVYYDAARSRFGPESLERGNLTTLQAFILMSNYLQKRDRPNTAFNIMGIAHRLAFGLGLHIEPNQQGGADTFSTLRRRIIFWVLYCFDSGFSLTTGRPTFMLDSFIGVSIPRNVDDANCLLPGDQPTEVPHPTSYSAIIAQARLARLANKAYAQFSSVSPCADADQQTSVMEHMLQNWRSSLPGYFFDDDVPVWFKRCRKIVLWKESNVRILILLASQRQRSDLHEKISVGKRYQAVAAETLTDICAFFNDSRMAATTGFCWYAVYFMLQAALALSVHEMANCNISSLPPGQEHRDPRTYDQLMDQAGKCLEHLAQFDHNGATALRGLAQLQKGVVRSRSDAINTTSPLNHETTPVSAPQHDVLHVTNVVNSRHRQARAFNQVRAPESLQNPTRTAANLPDVFPYGTDHIFSTAHQEIMETSFSAFDDRGYLSGVFHDCYGPFEFNHGPGEG